MKKILAITVFSCLLGTMATAPAYAWYRGWARTGDSGWATTGKVLTGIIGLSILGNAIAHSNPYPAPAYGPPPGYYYPPEQVWVPGHYETRFDRRWIPGHWEIGRPGSNRHDDDDDYGPRRGRYWVPGHYSDVEVRVWIPGHWEG